MTISRANVLTLMVVILTVVLVATYTYRAQKQNTSIDTEAAEALGSSNVESQYTLLDGTPIDLLQYDGQVRVVNSWASWCPFCRDELPILSELAAEFSDEKIVFLAINRQEDPRLVNAYIDRFSDVENIIFVLDPTDAFYEKINGFAMPETVFYNPAGEVVFHKRGHMNQEEIRSYIEASLQQTSD